MTPLTKSQKHALVKIAEKYPAALHEANAWTAGTSLARKGLAIKRPARAFRDTRTRAGADYHLTPNGIAMLRPINGGLWQRIEDSISAQVSASGPRAHGPTCDECTYIGGGHYAWCSSATMASEESKGALT